MKTAADKSSLVSVLFELGSACCEANILEDILSQIVPSCKNPEAQAAQALFMIAENSKNDKAWNTELFVQVLVRLVHSQLLFRSFNALPNSSPR